MVGQKTIEAKCPQIAANDAELWRTYIKRDILHWEKKLVEPEDPTTWWQVYEVGTFASLTVFYIAVACSC